MGCAASPRASGNLTRGLLFALRHASRRRRQRFSVQGPFLSQGQVKRGNGPSPKRRNYHEQKK
jgi:hypothetical protein